MYELWLTVSPIVWSLVKVFAVFFIGKKVIGLAVNLVKN